MLNIINIVYAVKLIENNQPYTFSVKLYFDSIN